LIPPEYSAVVRPLARELPTRVQFLMSVDRRKILPLNFLKKESMF
jgi:hypothetical protein